MAHYDAIVLGLGGMGSAALYHLAARGMRVLGLERYDIPNDMGSYHGVNRIIRLAYWEHPAYVPLLHRAYELWRRLELEAGEQVLVITGGLDFGPEDSPTFAGALRSAREYHIQHEVLDGDAVNRRFPGYRLPSDMRALYQPDAGFVMSERAVVAYVDRAMAHGADVRARSAVIGWEPEGAGVRVHTERESFTADRLVVAAGAWAGRVLPELRDLAVPERQVLIWTRPLRPEYFRADRFPVFNMEGPEGRFYGFPEYGIPGFKLGKYHHRGEVTDPDAVDRDIHPEDEEVLREAIRRYFPDADGATLSMKTCMFTNTPDEHFILDRHPRYPQVSIAAGFSGHGFKFCSVVGEIMADLAMDRTPPFDLSLFRIDRFGAGA